MFSDLYKKWWILNHWLSLAVHAAATAAKSLQSCPNLCDPTDGSPPGSLVPGILQARTLEWVQLCIRVCKVASLVSDFVTPWTIACQAPLSMGFSRQEYWNGLPCSPPGELPYPGIKVTSPALAGGFFTTSAAWEAPVSSYRSLKCFKEN